MKRFKIKLICNTVVFLLLLSVFITKCFSAEEDAPWDVRHFENVVPKVTAEVALSLVKSERKVLIIATPANIPYEESHVCGAVKVKNSQVTKLNVNQIPKDYTVLCY